MILSPFLGISEFHKYLASAYESKTPPNLVRLHLSYSQVQVIYANPGSGVTILPPDFGMGCRGGEGRVVGSP